MLNPLAGPVAQRLEPATHNRLVGGSNPSRPNQGLSIVRASRCRVPRAVRPPAAATHSNDPRGDNGKTLKAR